MVGRGILLRSFEGGFYIINIIITCQKTGRTNSPTKKQHLARQSIETFQSVILNWFQDLTDAKCSAKHKVGKMLNMDDNSGALELALQHDMAYGL